MFLWQHIVSAVVLATLVALLSNFRRWFMPLLTLTLLAQAVDLDHYSGNLELLGRCALVIDQGDPILPMCGSMLHRGMFHNILFAECACLFILVFVVLSGKWEYLIFVTAWLVHLWMDELIFV